MTNNLETGYAKNVTNFGQLISVVSGYGSKYNPARTTLQIPALQVLQADGRATIDGLNTATSAYSIAVTAREARFEPLSRFVTRIYNAVKSTDTTDAVDEHVKSLTSKIQGANTATKLTDEEKEALKAEGKKPREVSNSQMSYDSRVENFGKLIPLLSSIPQYNPNEPELQISALIAYHNDLKSSNDAAISARVALDNARIARNKVIDGDKTGLVDIGADVKSYVKSLYGANSAEYKQISKIAFTKQKS